MWPSKWKQLCFQADQGVKFAAMETGLDRVRSVWGSYLGVKSSDQSHKFNGNLQKQELIWVKKVCKTSAAAAHS